MDENRVKAAFWVGMALRLGAADGRYGVVVRKGDPDAGGVLVVLRGARGASVLSQIRGVGGEPAWLRATGPDGVEEAEAARYVDRQVGRDPDLWVLEFESPDLLPPFEARIVG